MRRLLCLAALLMLTGPARSQPAPQALVTALSQQQVDIIPSFDGATVSLFGAIDQRVIGGKSPVLDLIVTLRGPGTEVTVRRKSRVAGVWLNTEAVRLQTAPGYYAIASTRPLPQVIDETTAAIYELGVNSLHFSPGESGPPPEVLRAFQSGFVHLRKKEGLFEQGVGQVAFVEDVLFRANFTLPARAPVGEYRATVFLVKNGEVIASRSTPLVVRKIGFERWVYTFAHDSSLAYGVFAVLLALIAGLAAGTVGRR